MNRELEAIVLAYDTALQSRGEDLKRARETYRSLLERYLEKHPGLSVETLDRMVRRYYPRWLAAQKKPPSIPPKA